MPHIAYIAIPVVAVAAIATIMIEARLPQRVGVSDANGAAQRQTYLFPNHLPDSLALLPPPPASGSPQMKRDVETREAVLNREGTPRYLVATADAMRSQPATMQVFTCALGTDISETRTPTLYRLLAAVRVDVRASAYPASNRYRRPKPFELYHAKTCSPEDEQLVKGWGSYPDARTAVGWAYALILARLNSTRAPEIIQRGRDFGQSRVICDASWQSDVDAARTLAEADVARLLQNRDFQKDLAAARGEVAAELKAGVKPSRDCGREAAALAMR